jgi:hypothetical protein
VADDDRDLGDGEECFSRAVRLQEGRESGVAGADSPARNTTPRIRQRSRLPLENDMP